MIQTDMQSKAGEVFLDVVEKLTFMFGEHVDKAEITPIEEDMSLARMTFDGDLTGELLVCVPTELCSEMAGNILGLEPEDIDSDEMIMDALKEMLNVVCGHVIMEIIGTGANFKLDSPLTESPDTEELGAMLADANFEGFLLDDSPALYGLVLKEN